MPFFILNIFEIKIIILFKNLSINAVPVASTTSTTRQLTPVDQEIITQMIAMGFSPELAQEAVNRSPPDSLEQAVEYCFNHPNHTPTTMSTGPSSVREALERANNTADGLRAAIDASAAPESGQSQAMPRIEQNATSTESLSVLESGSLEAPMPEASSSVEEEVIHQLDKQILDKFASTMLPGLMKILDNVPDTVYRVCELIVVVAKKYGDTWRDGSLAFILEEICELIKQVCEIYKKNETGMVLETSTSNKSKCFL